MAKDDMRRSMSSLWQWEQTGWTSLLIVFTKNDDTLAQA